MNSPIIEWETTNKNGSIIITTVHRDKKLGSSATICTRDSPSPLHGERHLSCLKWTFWKAQPDRTWIRDWAWHCPFAKSRLAVRDSLRRVLGETPYEVRESDREEKNNFFLSFSSLSFLLFDSLNEPCPQDYNNRMFYTHRPIRTNYFRSIFIL